MVLLGGQGMYLVMGFLKEEKHDALHAIPDEDGVVISFPGQPGQPYAIKASQMGKFPVSRVSRPMPAW